MSLLMNEQIKAVEVSLSGLNGEKLGIVSRTEALAMARAQGLDLICLSLMSSPPPCQLVPKGKGKEMAQKAHRSENAKLDSKSPSKISDAPKELRLTPHIEDHDYETKRRQAEQWLRAGKSVLIVAKASGAKEAADARTLVEQMCNDLKAIANKASGIQSGGKGSQIRLNPR